MVTATAYTQRGAAGTTTLAGLTGGVAIPGSHASISANLPSGVTSWAFRAWGIEEDSAAELGLTRPGNLLAGGANPSDFTNYAGTGKQRLVFTGVGDDGNIYRATAPIDRWLLEKQTTGSITAGTATLTVADATGLRVGDWLVIATGGEAGAGARGTKGVGGTWPALSYANATAMNADDTQDADTACWLEDTGDVWYYASGTWTQVTDDYYLEKAVPKALVAEITAISDNTITLDRNAAATTTNAEVYFDNWGPIQSIIDDNLTVNLPAGTFGMSCHLFISDRDGINVSGAGKDVTILKTPQGAAHGGFQVNLSDNVVISDMTIDCRFKNTGYGFRFNDSRVVAAGGTSRIMPETYRAGEFGYGIVFENCLYEQVNDCKIINPAVSGLASGGSTDAWYRRCDIVVEDPIRRYTQWMIGFDNQIGGGAEDCTIDSNWLISGFEQFKSRNITIRRCTGRNAVIASNASDGGTWEDLDLTFENAAGGLSHRNGDTPILSFAANVDFGFGTNATQIINPTITQIGVPSDQDNRRLRVLSITDDTYDVCPVTITGTYDSDPTTPKGLIDVQGDPTGVDSFEGLAIRSSGTLTVEGIRIKGSPPTGKTSMVHTEGGTLNITNSIFDASTPTGTATITASGNQTNAEYEA